MKRISIFLLTLCFIFVSATSFAETNYTSDSLLTEITSGNYDVSKQILEDGETIYRCPIYQKSVLDCAMIRIEDENSAVAMLDLLTEYGENVTQQTFLNAATISNFNLFSYGSVSNTFDSSYINNTQYLKLKKIYELLDDKEISGMPDIVKYSITGEIDKIQNTDISDVDIEDLKIATFFTAAFGRPMEMKKLLENGVDVKTTDKSGNSLYKIAAKYDNCNMLESLDYAGALKDFSQEDKKNLMLFAMKNNAYNTIKYLLINEIAGIEKIDDLIYIDSEIFQYIYENQETEVLQIILDSDYRVHASDILCALDFTNTHNNSPFSLKITELQEKMGS